MSSPRTDRKDDVPNGTPTNKPSPFAKIELPSQPNKTFVSALTIQLQAARKLSNSAITDVPVGKAASLQREPYISALTKSIQLSGNTNNSASGVNTLHSAPSTTSNSGAFNEAPNGASTEVSANRLSGKIESSQPKTTHVSALNIQLQLNGNTNNSTSGVSTLHSAPLTTSNSGALNDKSKSKKPKKVEPIVGKYFTPMEPFLEGRVSQGKVPNKGRAIYSSSPITTFAGTNPVTRNIPQSIDTRNNNFDSTIQSNTNGNSL